MYAMNRRLKRMGLYLPLAGNHLRSFLIERRIKSTVTP
jgi:hypothetical protein